MRTFLQKIFKNFFPLLAALAVSSVSYAQTIDTGDWLHIKYGARDLVVSSEENITYLDRNFQARRLDAEKRRSRKLWGKFSKLTVGVDGSIWGLSLKGNLYLLQNDIWQPLELDMEVDNFSVGSDAIYIVSGGKIEALTLSGQKGHVIRYPDLLAVRSFDQLTGNKFVLLQDDGQLIVLTPDERQVLDKDVKNVLFVRKDIIAVRKDTGNITFHLLTKNSSKQVFAENSANIKAMSVSADGRIWGATKRRIHYSPFTIEDLFNKMQHRLHEQNIKFKKLKKTRALRIFTGEDGTFRVNKTGNLELWLPEKEKFVLFPGRVSELSVAGYGQLWGINALGRIFHFRSGRWEQRFGIATSISARAGAVMITDARNSVHRYDWKLKRFKRLKLKARTVAVQNQRVYWILKDRGKISRCNQLKCKNIQGTAKKISISPDGVVFIVDPSGKLLRFGGRKFRLLKTPARKVRDVAAGIGGLPWIIDEEFRVHAGIVKKGQNFILAENKNPYIPKGKVETDNATQGVGVALLDGLVLKGSKLAETADAPEEGFIFQRQVKFRKIPNSEYFFDLSMGRDGRLWALIATGPERVFQFREKTRIFEVYNSSNFPSRRQPFLGLPETTNVSSIISDREGRIWAVEDASKTVHYQERRNGSFKSILISNAGDNIQDITVDLEGNVYVAASSIFLKKPRDKRFTKIFEKGGPFLRLSSGPSGTLWAVNSAGQAFELIDDSLVRRARIKAQDIDISVTGVVYGTSPTQTPWGPNEPGAGLVVASENLLCNLEKWNVVDKKSDIVVNFVKHAQYVAVSRDGTPWTTCAPSGDRDIYRGRN